ncbi:hypothetical protein Q5P01_016712 [Channa striata]|uniref:Ig-like domain-containing protein n=1 Tax=Channa striata TaxID=64152 RepID=A0AA88SI76_CHASR|nr:hypothetical protein Q5P01_016712 [Channa striata]
MTSRGQVINDTEKLLSLNHDEQTTKKPSIFDNCLFSLGFVFTCWSVQQPNILLTCPDGGLFLSLQGAEVTSGYSFVITCSIYSIYPEGRFFLIFSGSTITDTKSAVNYSASFNFPVAQYEHQGNYSCVYEVTLSTRRFSSTESAPITVIVTMSLLPLVSSVTAGILLLLLLFVAFFIYRRRRQDN